MTRKGWRREAWRGFAWGAVAGLALVALMYLAGALLGLRPLPQALSGPVLALMPGFVFGFLIDTLQHAGKVVEELGLILAMVIGLGVLGAAWAVTSRRWRFAQSALVFSALGWLVVAALLLPVSGDGFLGLNAGPTTPLVWAVLFAVYGVVLQMGSASALPEAADPGRRRTLGAIPLAIGAISLGVLALRLAPGWYRAIFQPPEAGLSGATPEITPIPNFYVISKNLGGDPVVSEHGWSLSVGGAVDKPLKLTLADLHGLPSTTEYVTMECISNDVGGGLMSTGSFTGVSLRDLLAMARPRAGGTWAAFKARDGYAESLPLSMINGAPEFLVAYDLDGAPLPAAHGFPARILLPGHYGMKGPKWLDSIELVDHESGGYWEAQGWDHNAVVRTTARIDVPRGGDIIKLGDIALSGVAFAGSRGVSKVEYSTDGRSWITADLKAPLSPMTWVLWSAVWTPAVEGDYQLRVRATDGTGVTQEARGAGSFPSGATGYHTIHVIVSKS